MTGKQEKFVQEYLANGRNGSAAYRAAYDCSRMSSHAIEVEASRLLKTPEISLRVKAVIAKVEEATGITAQYVLERLKIEAELSGEGSSHAARVRAIELLGKTLGMFTENLNVRHSINVKVVMADNDFDPESA